jgi:colicin import membrane protein
MLALLVHVGLVVALAFGVSWRSSEPTGASAELWAAVPEFAAPSAVAPPPEPVAVPTPKVEVPPPAPLPEVREADIALEKAKADKVRRDAEERESRQKAEAKKQHDEQDRIERETAAKAAQARAEKAEAERVAKLREDQLKRIQGQAGVVGGTGAPNAAGTAQRDAGPSAGYAGRIVARVKPNIVLTESVPSTLRAEVEVRCAPDGTIIGRRLVKSSGNKDWDDAVLRALDRTEVLPRDTDGRVPAVMTIGFTPA